jgi:hypothetical protein
MGSIFSAIYISILCVKDSEKNQLVNMGASFITVLFNVILPLPTSTAVDWDMAMRLTDKTPLYIKGGT